VSKSSRTCRKDTCNLTLFLSKKKINKIKRSININLSNKLFLEVCLLQYLDVCLEIFIFF